MADRIIRIILSGSSASAVRAFEQTAAASEAAEAKVGGIGKLATVLKNPWVDTGLAIGTVAVGIGAAAVDMASKYETATSKMAAQAGITNAAAKTIGAAFLTTSGQSTFSAQQMMDAFGPVAGQLATTAGHALSASEALQEMAASSDLAEASGMDLLTATSSLAKVIQTFHLNVGQAAAASDVLFNSSRVLALPVDQVAQAVDKLKGRLGLVAPTLLDTATLMTDMGEHGISGTRGVMVVNTALQTLLGGSKNVALELKTLGVSVFDASGKFVGMQSVIAQLQPKLAGMTDQQRILAEKTLFGATAGQAMNGILSDGAVAYGKVADQVDRLGSAQKGAQVATNNLTGSMDRAKAAMGNAGVQIGGVLMPWIDTMARGLAVIAQWAAQNLPGALRAFGTVASEVLDTVARDVGALVKLISILLGVVGAIAGAVKGAAGAIIGAFQATFGWVKDHIVQPLVDTIEAIPKAIGSVVGTAGKIGGGIVGTAGKVGGAIVGGVGNVAGGIGHLLGFADGGFIPPGSWGVTGEKGLELTYGGNTGVSVMPLKTNSRGGQPITITQHFTLHGNDERLLRQVQQIVEDNNDKLSLAVQQRTAA